MWEDLYIKLYCVIQHILHINFIQKILHFFKINFKQTIKEYENTRKCTVNWSNNAFWITEKFIISCEIIDFNPLIKTKTVQIKEIIKCRNHGYQPPAIKTKHQAQSDDLYIN